MEGRKTVDAALWRTVDEVCRRFPGVFVHPSVQPRQSLPPLGLSISDDLKAAMPEADPALLERFLDFYTTRFWYYRCLTSPAAARIGLDGSPCGRVSVAEADEAQAHYDRMLKARSRKPQSELCEGSGKTIYTSGGAALAAASRVRRTLGDRRETSVYRCSHCGRFHWGHDVAQQPPSGKLSLYADQAFKHSKRHIETLIHGD